MLRSMAAPRNVTLRNVTPLIYKEFIVKARAVSIRMASESRYRGHTSKVPPHGY